MLIHYNINNVHVAYDNKDFSHQEVESYLKIAKAKIANITSLSLKPEGNTVACEYTARDIPFERIRRITGYLTGDLTSWNNAKRSEEQERVKHEVDDYEL